MSSETDHNRVTNPLLEITAHLFDRVMPLRAGGSDAPDDLHRCRRNDRAVA